VTTAAQPRMNAWVRAKDVHSTDHFQDQEGRQMKEGLIRSGSGLVKVLLALLLCAAGATLASAEAPGKADPPMDPPDHHTGDAGPQHPEHGNMGSIGAKLADPTSDLWAIQLNFQGPHSTTATSTWEAPSTVVASQFSPSCRSRCTARVRTSGR
jgi:hypothetical protein